MKRIKRISYREFKKTGFLMHKSTSQEELPPKEEERGEEAHNKLTIIRKTTEYIEEALEDRSDELEPIEEKESEVSYSVVTSPPKVEEEEREEKEEEERE